MTAESPSDYSLIVLSRPPYAGNLARAALDLALAYAVFNQSPRILFQGAGAQQLRDGQAPDKAGRKSLRRVIDSMPMYDLDEIYVARESLERFAISADDLPAHAKILEPAAIARLRAGACHVLSL